MLKILLTLLVLLSADIAFGCPTERHPLYCTILELQPHADPQWAMELSNSISKHARTAGVDPYLLLAIGMQESSLRDVNRLRGTEITDVGVFQLHVRTITAHGYDYERLLADVDYQVQAASDLLAAKIKLCTGRASMPFACYHSITPALRMKYKEQVLRYYRGDEQHLIAQEL